MKIIGPGWPSEKGWMKLGFYSQTMVILLMIYVSPELRSDTFFQTIATAIVLTGWVNSGKDNGDEERKNTTKALDIAKSQTANSADVSVTGENVTVTKESK